MTTFNWLHLTDLHYGETDQDWMWPNMREEFYRDIERQRGKCGPWDLILFTGDLTNRADFGEVSAVLEEIRDRAAANDKKPILLAVPGNHDLERPKQDHPFMEKLYQWSEDEDVRENFWAQESEYRPFVEKSFANYREWWKSNIKSIIDDYQVGLLRAYGYQEGLLPGDFLVTIEKDGCRLGVVGLNTAFLDVLSGRKEGQIALHTRQFYTACPDRDGAKWIGQHHACLLMTHHSPEWLDKKSRENHLLGEIRQDDRFIHLCGHVHGASHNCSEKLFRACSLFGLRETKDGRERQHGYAAGRIDLDGKKGEVRFWPRVAVKEEEGSSKMRLQPEVALFLNADEHTQPIEFELPLPCEQKREDPAIPKPGAPYSPDCCVRRTSLVEKALAELRKGGHGPHSPPVFSGPRGFGKHWLIQDTLRELNRNDRYEIRYLKIDTEFAEEASSSLPKFFRWFADRLIGDTEIVRDYFEQYETPALATTELMKHHLKGTTSPFVLVIESADQFVSYTVGKYSVGKELLKLLRSWINRAGGQPDPWVRFLLLMSVETDFDYLKDILRKDGRLYHSPFNLAENIPVGPFTDDDVSKLADIFGIVFTEEEKRFLKGQFGNHPSLMIAALQHVYQEGKDWKRIDEGNEWLRNHLKSLAQELRTTEKFGTFDDIRKGRTQPWDDDIHESLERKGLIVRNRDDQQEIPELSCELYKKIL